MGVKGFAKYLNSFIDEKSFEEIIDPNKTVLIVDASSFAFHVYDKCIDEVKPEYGGNYLIYKQKLEIALEVWLRAGFTLKFVTDSADIEEAKMQVKLERRQNDVKKYVKIFKYLKSLNGGRGTLVRPYRQSFPCPVLLMTEFFCCLERYEADSKLEIVKVVRGEADPVIGILARNIENSIVLSADSDFFFMEGIRYCPFDFFHGEVACVFTAEKTAEIIGTQNVDHLQKLAVYLGNDYAGNKNNDKKKPNTDQRVAEFLHDSTIASSIHCEESILLYQNRAYAGKKVLEYLQDKRIIKGSDTDVSCVQHASCDDKASTIRRLCWEVDLKNFQNEQVLTLQNKILQTFQELDSIDFSKSAIPFVEKLDMMWQQCTHGIQGDDDTCSFIKASIFQQVYLHLFAKSSRDVPIPSEVYLIKKYFPKVQFKTISAKEKEHLILQEQQTFRKRRKAAVKRINNKTNDKSDNSSQTRPSSQPPKVKECNSGTCDENAISTMHNVVPHAQGHDSKEPKQNISKRVSAKIQLSKWTETLPIDAHRDDILQRIRSHRVTLIHGETGSGKSSRLPLYVMEEDPRNKIVICQPGRFAAQALYEHMNAHLGNLVALRLGGGYKQGSTAARLVYVTTGYLRKWSSNRTHLSDFTHIIIDEVHDRSADNDLLCYNAKKMMESNPHIKIILMSATLQYMQYLEYFGISEKPLFVGAKRFKQTEYWLDSPELKSMLGASSKTSQSLECVLKQMAEETKRNRISTSLNLVRKLNSTTENELLSLAKDLVLGIRKETSDTGILVFVQGINDIEELVKQFEIENQKRFQYELVVIHSSIAQEEQSQATSTKRKGITRVIIATNAAESSVTLATVDHVICLGSRKVAEYDSQVESTMLGRSWISKSSATQRAGRTGRVRPGTVYRLYTKDIFETFREFDCPEILTCSLESVILDLKCLAVGSVAPVLEQLMNAPDPASVEQSLNNLYSSGLVDQPDDDVSKLTQLGSTVSKLGVDPRWGVLIIKGIILGIPSEAIALAAILSTSENPFRNATPLAIKDPLEFHEVLTMVMTTMHQLDGGLISEPMMMMRVLSTFQWMSVNSQKNCKDYGLVKKRLHHINAHYKNLMSKFRSSIAFNVHDDRLPHPNTIFANSVVVNKVRYLLSSACIGNLFAMESLVTDREAPPTEYRLDIENPDRIFSRFDLHCNQSVDVSEIAPVFSIRENGFLRCEESHSVSYSRIANNEPSPKPRQPPTAEPASADSNFASRLFTHIRTLVFSPQAKAQANTRPTQQERQEVPPMPPRDMTVLHTIPSNWDWKLLLASNGTVVFNEGDLQDLHHHLQLERKSDPVSAGIAPSRNTIDLGQMAIQNARKEKKAYCAIVTDKCDVSVCPDGGRIYVVMLRNFNMINNFQYFVDRDMQFQIREHLIIYEHPFDQVLMSEIYEWLNKTFIPHLKFEIINTSINITGNVKIASNVILGLLGTGWKEKMSSSQKNKSMVSVYLEVENAPANFVDDYPFGMKVLLEHQRNRLRDRGVVKLSDTKTIKCKIPTPCFACSPINWHMPRSEYLELETEGERNVFCRNSRVRADGIKISGNSIYATLKSDATLYCVASAVNLNRGSNSFATSAFVSGVTVLPEGTDWLYRVMACNNVDTPLECDNETRQLCEKFNNILFQKMTQKHNYKASKELDILFDKIYGSFSHKIAPIDAKHYGICDNVKKTDS